MKMIPPSLSRALAKQALMASKNSPQLLLGVGVVGMVGSTVLACRATLKLESVIDETQDMLDKARDSVGKQLTDGGTYSAQDSKKDIAVVYVRGAFKIVKLYGPAIIVGSAAIFCLTKSHNILQQRNGALAAAYIAVDSAFKQYRARVIDKYGAQQDLEFRHASEEVTVIDDQTGKIRTETRVAPGEPSMYARFFDQLCPSWSPQAEYNMIYLSHKQSYWNDILNTRGHVFLNEVYDGLGLPMTKAGAVTGWLRDTKLSGGDGYIDFGIWHRGTQETINFVNGREGAILLDFNVDGLVYNLIEEPEEKIAWQS